MSGQIVRLISTKGFGFIRGEDEQEYFFHRSALERRVRFDMLREGQRVRFEPVNGQKGLRAEGVILQI